MAALKFDPADGAPDKETAAQIKALQAACAAERPAGLVPCPTCWTAVMRSGEGECSACREERRNISQDRFNYY